MKMTTLCVITVTATCLLTGGWASPDKHLCVKNITPQCIAWLESKKLLDTVQHGVKEYSTLDLTLYNKVVVKDNGMSIQELVVWCRK